MEFEIGVGVNCADGQAGKVVALIADPAAGTLAHIAVEPEHDPGAARLVPVTLVKAASAAGVELGCSLAELSRLPEFHDVEFVPTVSDFGDPGNMLLGSPYYGLPDQEVPLIVDRVPPGEVEIQRHDRVHATDGEVGQVEGLVVDGDGLITHVLLKEGHVWARKEVAIPIGSLDKVTAEGIHVRLSKREISELPELGVSHPSLRFRLSAGLPAGR